MAGVQAKGWSLAQLGGPGKTGTLEGWEAPFGRPRQSPIINAGLSVRRSITYYTDGNNGPTEPTVHAFGTEPKPIELHGRFMDSSVGIVGRARERQLYWKTFVSDKQYVRLKWGDILSYVVFLHDVDLQYESESHVVWKLIADVIRDDQAPAPVHQPPTPTPVDFTSQLQTQLRGAIPFTDDSGEDLEPFVGDTFFNVGALLADVAVSIALLVSTMQDPSDALYATSLALSDFSTADPSDLGKMASDLQTLQLGVEQMSDASTFALSRLGLLATASLATPLGLLSGPDQIALATSKADSDAQTENLLALIADMLAQIARATRGLKNTTVTARDGDTWESIAVRTLGGPGGARAIKNANGIRYGQRPQPGTTYQVPRSG